MLRKRLIFTLLVCDDVFFISRNFNLQKVGDINWLYKNYNFNNISKYIDELVLLDVSRNRKNIDNLCKNLDILSTKCFVPLSVGGGINNLEKVKKVLKHGADKIVINSSIFYDKKFLYELSKFIGSQSIIGSLDYKEIDKKYTFYTHNGSKVLKFSDNKIFDLINKLPIGELYLKSINKDGTGQGLDFEILKKVKRNFTKRIILSGGIGNKDHLAEGFKNNKIDAVATSNLFHFIGNGFSNSREYIINKKLNLAIREKY